MNFVEQGKSTTFESPPYQGGVARQSLSNRPTVLMSNLIPELG